MSHFVGRVYPDGPPSIAALARDFTLLEQAGGYPGETPDGAKARRANARRLHRGAKVEAESAGSLGVFILRRGLRKYALWTAVILLATTLFSPGNWTVTTSVAEVGTLLVLAGAVGVIASAMQWSGARDALLWAETYRDEYYAVQQRMLRPEGEDGSRIVRNAAGNWELIEDSQV